jgi:signal transduction histidine kinase
MKRCSVVLAGGRNPMKIITTDRLTSAWLQKLKRYNIAATGLAVLLVAFSLFWMLFRLDGNEATIHFADIAYCVAALLGAAWTFQSLYRGQHGPVHIFSRQIVAWRLIALALLFLCAGGAYYAYLDYIGLSPFPSPADILFNIGDVLLFIGILLMPAMNRFRVRTMLDALISTLCLIGVSWFFVIGPIYCAHVHGNLSFSNVAALSAALTYPFWDLMLLFILLLYIQRGLTSELFFPVSLLALGLFSCFWADAAYAYTNLITHTYHSGTPYIDPFWFSAFLLIGLAALHQYSAIAHRAYNKRQQNENMISTSADASIGSNEHNGKIIKFWRRLQSLLVYIPLTFMLGLMVYGELFHDGPTSDGLVVLTAITATLVATRYLLTNYQNDRLLRERSRQHEESERLRSAARQLTEILELERLREGIVRAATSDLGYDAALLLLAGEHSGAPDLHVTASLTSMSAKHWILHGDNLLYRTCVSGKEVDVMWDEQRAAIPSEILAWQRVQGITRMSFFPLIYQGEIRGSLGVGRLGTPSLSRHDTIILKSFTDHVATVLEHARLYQEAREHEAFAQAMINIATRLNTAVVEPSEIGQLICEEGAGALSADYVLLYTESAGGKLIPLATYTSDTASLPAPDEWPPIYPEEYEAQALQLLQPTILAISDRSVAVTHPLPAVSTAFSGTGGARSDPMLTQEQARPVQSSLREMLAACAVRTVILAPLIARGDTVGLLIFARAQSATTGMPEKGTFDLTDLSQAQDFGEQAGVAFTNARLYQRLHSAHMRLQELDHMKDQFIATASHELRTPLTAIQGYIELLAQFNESLPTEQRHEFLQKARRGCDELVVLLGNVMDASSLEENDNKGARIALLKRISLQEAIDGVILLIEPHLAQEQRELHVNIPPNLFIYADPVRLRQVLMNLCTNALKYSPAHSPIDISARICVEQEKDYAIINISDKGKGIAPQDQARLFQRFVRLESDINSPVRGSGLGLYISRRLIEGMNGKIWIESSGIPGEGSTFHVQLPLADNKC